MAAKVKLSSKKSNLSSASRGGPCPSADAPDERDEKVEQQQRQEGAKKKNSKRVGGGRRKKSSSSSMTAVAGPVLINKMLD